MEAGEEIPLEQKETKTLNLLKKTHPPLTDHRLKAEAWLNNAAMNGLSKEGDRCREMAQIELLLDISDMLHELRPAMWMSER